jgi:S-adenosylmethionine-diacylglycerol 3-amino-3-carboxypropyl transferase
VSTQSPRYFHHLNYSLGNEDSTVEWAVLPERGGRVLCVAGCGSRVLPLVARQPSHVVCADVSASQLHVTELRVEAARALEHADYLRFFGYPPDVGTPEGRRRLFERIALSDDTRSFWLDVFDHQGWESILYDGRWERTFRKLSRVNGVLTRERGRSLFDARTVEEHAAYVRDRFPRKAWLLTLLLLGNPVVFNLMLYKGDFPRKNLPGTPFQFYRRAFDKLFAQGPSRENFFLQIVFFGKVRFAEGNPIECRPDVYERIRSALPNVSIEYRRGDILEVAHAEGGAFDFVSLSDVPSYFAPPREQTYLQDLRPALSPGARVVLRYYLRRPERTVRAGYRDITASFEETIANEKVGVYDIEVLAHDGASPSDG